MPRMVFVLFSGLHTVDGTMELVALLTGTALRRRMRTILNGALDIGRRHLYSIWILARVVLIGRYRMNPTTRHILIPAFRPKMVLKVPDMLISRLGGSQAMHGTVKLVPLLASTWPHLRITADWHVVIT